MGNLLPTRRQTRLSTASARAARVLVNGKSIPERKNYLSSCPAPVPVGETLNERNLSPDVNAQPARFQQQVKEILFELRNRGHQTRQRTLCTLLDNRIGI